MAIPELTEEQKAKAKVVAEEVIKKVTAEKKAVEEDKSGIEGLVSAAKAADPGSSAPGTEGLSGAKSVWEGFKSATKEVSKWAHDFITQLKNAPLHDDTKKKISGVCHEYKDLMQATSLELQGLRGDVKSKFNAFEDVMNLIIPPGEESKKLEQLATEEEKQALIATWVKENKDELQKALKKFTSKLADDTVSTKVKKLQGQWSDLTKAIEGVVHQVDADVKEFRNKMSILLGVALIVTAVLGAVVVVLSAGTAAPAITAAVGSLGVVVAGGLAAVTVVGMVAFGIALLAEPEIARVIKLTQDGLVSSVKEGLNHIAEQSDRVETMLGTILKDYHELLISKPGEEVEVGWGGKAKVNRLLENMKATKENLKKLEEDIKSTETVLDDELAVYTEKVYKPLLDMYS